MEVVDLYAIAVLSLLSMRVLYTDMRFGKIRNKDLLWGFAAAVGSFVLYGCLMVLYGYVLSGAYVVSFLWNGLVALLVAYIFWIQGIWAAGDGKLFVVVSLLIPLSWYAGTYYGLFPSFVLLMNMFVPLIVFLLLRLFWLVLFGGGKRFVQGFQGIDRRALVLGGVQFLALYFAGRIVLRTLMSPLRDMVKGLVDTSIQWISDDNAVMVIALILSLRLMKLLKKNKWIYGAALALLFASLGYEVVVGQVSLQRLLGQFFTVVVVFVLALAVLRVFAHKLLRFLRTEGVLVEELRPGLLLTEKAVAKLQERDKEVFGDLEIMPDGLNAVQVATIQAWFQQEGNAEHPKESLEVYMTTAFGPFIILGIVLTFFLRGSLLALFF